MPTAVILGGTGFIGKYVIHEMMQRSWRIRVLSRNPSSRRAVSILVSKDVGQIAIENAESYSESLILKAIQDADVLINCVGNQYDEDHDCFEFVHSTVPANIAAAVNQLHNKPRVIHLSALSVETKQTNGIVSDIPYANSKARGEQYMTQLDNCVVVRPSITYGPGDKFFNRIAHIASISPVCVPAVGLDTRFNPIYAADLAKAIANISVMQHPSKIYEMEGVDSVTYHDCIMLTLKIIDKNRLIIPVPFLFGSTFASLVNFASHISFGMIKQSICSYDQLALMHNALYSKSNNSNTAGMNEAEIISEASLCSVLPRYLSHYRVHGEFNPAGTE